MRSRRDFLGAAALAASGIALAPLSACGQAAPGAPAPVPSPSGGAAGDATPPPAPPAAGALLTRDIPRTGEPLPVIGAGTSGSYEVLEDSGAYDTLREVAKVFFEGGGTVFDTSPNYTNADAILGALLADGGWRERCFLATKIAADDRPAMEAQWAETQRRLRTTDVELLQVHNLRAWREALPYAKELQAQGRTRYVGLTHYLASGHAKLEQVMRSGRPDFIQVNYSVNAPQAATRLLPAARDLGVAVMVNRAFDDGRLFAQVAGKALPGWAAEAGIGSWSQLFLKFVISHPAVTVVIPATGKPDRQADQLRAGSDVLLTQAQQDELTAMFA